MNFPSLLVTEKYGCAKTPANELIQGWTSHLIMNIPSALPKDLVDSFTVGGIAMLKGALTFGRAWTLCRIPSEFSTLNG